MYIFEFSHYMKSIYKKYSGNIRLRIPESFNVVYQKNIETQTIIKLNYLTEIYIPCKKIGENQYYGGCRQLDQGNCTIEIAFDSSNKYYRLSERFHRTRGWPMYSQPQQPFVERVRLAYYADTRDEQPQYLVFL